MHVGSTTLQGTDGNRVTLATSTSVVHPDYNANTFEHDIGLIRLRLAINFNRKCRTKSVGYIKSNLHFRIYFCN